MKRTGSVLCPSCGSLVGVNDEQCLTCGRRNPGLWGFTAVLRELGDDMGFARLVLWACGALFLASLAVDVAGIGMQGILSFLSPSDRSLFLFGASGAVPVFRYGHWWTVLSAAWLHGGALHILFNMMWARDLLPPTARFYGAGRTVIIYTVAAITGFTASSVAGAFFTFMPSMLRGAGFITVGASAPIFGLLGALLHYGRRGGSSMVSQQAKSLALTMLFFGFVMPGVDNWAHLGGLGGGWLAAKLLDPLKPERGDHMVGALVCLALSLASILVSVVEGLKILR
jgi:rhomboid protease GluP